MRIVKTIAAAVLLCSVTCAAGLDRIGRRAARSRREIDHMPSWAFLGKPTPVREG